MFNVKFKRGGIGVIIIWLIVGIGCVYLFFGFVDICSVYFFMVLLDINMCEGNIGLLNDIVD